MNRIPKIQERKEWVFTVNHVAQLRHELVLLAVLPSWHKALIVRRVRIPIHINKEGWRHEMWGLLSLLIQHIVVGVADKRSVVRVEEHLVRNLEDGRKMFWELGTDVTFYPISFYLRFLPNLL